MRVYRLAEFLTLPEGTLYCKGGRWFFDQLCVKGESLGRDWSYLSLDSIEANDSGELFHRFEEMLESGASYPLEQDYSRDGCFDDDALFLVFERDDLCALATIVRQAQAAAEQTPNR